MGKNDLNKFPSKERLAGERNKRVLKDLLMKKDVLNTVSSFLLFMFIFSHAYCSFLSLVHTLLLPIVPIVVYIS
jgi:hypothetical protein